MKIGLVTDSTCDLSPDLLKKYQITAVPLNIHLEGEVYQDRVDLQAEEFYERLPSVSKLPSTSQPSVGQFLECYNNLKDKYDRLISIHLSGNLSGTVESATLASRQIEGIEVEVIDSYSASYGLGFQVLKAAMLIESGEEDIKEIKKQVEKVKNNTSVYFTVDDLKYLEKGGRIGKAQSLLGSVLKFNPILKLDHTDGQVTSYKKIRGETRTINEMADLFRSNFSSDNIWLSLLRAKEDDRFLKFSEKLKKDISDREDSITLFKSIISPVLGAHTGPSLYGGIICSGDFLKK